MTDFLSRINKVKNFTRGVLGLHLCRDEKDF